MFRRSVLGRVFAPHGDAWTGRAVRIFAVLWKEPELSTTADRSVPTTDTFRPSGSVERLTVPAMVAPALLAGAASPAGARPELLARPRVSDELADGYSTMPPATSVGSWPLEKCSIRRRTSVIHS